MDGSGDAGQSWRNTRAKAYSLWCTPAGTRSGGSWSCLCRSGSAAGCNGRSPGAILPSGQEARDERAPSSADRSSSEIAPSRSQMPK
jgi:hypothetical protein